MTQARDDRDQPAADVAAISALCGRADAERRAGRLDLAAGLLGEARTAARHHPEAGREIAAGLNNLAAAYVAAHQYAAAIEALEGAIGLVPDYPLAHANLAELHRNQGRIEEALDHLQRIEVIAGPSTDNLLAQGNALLQLERRGEARERFRAALELDPDHIGALDGDLHARLGEVDWTDLEADTERLIALFRRQPNAAPPRLIPPFHSVIYDIDNADRLNIAKAWSRQFAATAVASGTGPRSGPLRIGYLSGDFRRHATAHLMQALFAAHDRSRIRVHAYSTGPDDGSAERRRIANDCDAFVDLHGRDDDTAARAIVGDGIDIVVDLMGYSGSARPGILARRPAGLQISYLVYPGTTGAPWIDYIIADAVVLPPGHRRWFSEKVIALPRCYQVSDPGQEIDPRPARRDDWGLPEGAVVFACLNIAHKIEPVVFGLWMDILRTVPQSVLWLLADSDTARGNLRAAAAGAGIDPARLVFADRVARPRHLRRQQCADLFLDTLICNAHTTASDALFVGLPLLTVAGSSFAGRVSASLLTTLGLEELKAADGAAYRDMAIALARDRVRLADLRARTTGAATHSRLFDVVDFARAAEDAFALVWAAHIAGAAPDHVDVPPHTADRT